MTRIEGQGNGGNYLDLTAESVSKILSNPSGRENTITYENGRGPINIRVVDPLNVPNSNFSVALINRNYFFRNDTLAGNPAALNQYINSIINADPCKTSTVSIGGRAPHSTLPFPKLQHSSDLDGMVNQDTATWVLKDLNAQKSYYPCKSIKIGEEYYFADLGLSVTIGGTRDIAGIERPFNNASDKYIKQGDIIGASIGFASSGLNWLSGVPDVDGTDGFNWIRSGNYTDNNDPNLNDYETNNGATSNNPIFADENQYFENVLGGTWAPYALVAPSKTIANIIYAAPGSPNLITTTSGTAGSHANLLPVFDLRTLASVDIVITKDKSKWTRCLVLEESDEAAAIPSKANKLETRRKKSVDKQGIALGDPGCNTAEAYLDSAGTGQPFYTGLSWFPGYAINLETGERLNIAFGEDSYQANNNGDDMMWNPN
ncbi:MAG: hypothetical protein HY062_05090, partial [Bacteroidetes bacterium]|nr:hypothetical protein [Bacteroidota bacterium]